MGVPPILTKRQNYRLASSGAFGNKLRHWKTLDEVFASNFPGPISVRSFNSCWPCRFDLSLNEAARLVFDHCQRNHGDASDLYFNEGAPDQSILIQGELLNSFPYAARVSSEKVKMREALRRSFSDLIGWAALEVFRGNMSPSSKDDLEELLELYPDHVFEISVYSRNLGDCRGRNTLIWEVRRY